MDLLRSTVLACLLLALLPPAVASAAPPPRDAAAAVRAGAAAPETAGAVTLTAFEVEVACPGCDEGVRPAVVVTWRSGGEATDRITVRTVDWIEGRFELVGADGETVAVTGRGDEGGWTVEVPTGERGLPFRVVGTLPEHVAQRGVAWPAAEGRVRAAFEFVPVTAVLEQHPEWTGGGGDCPLQVTKDVATPLSFLIDGQPRAWLHRVGEGEDAEWFFHFVPPGATLLERLSLPVEPREDGQQLSFDLPLAGLVAGHGASAAPARPERFGRAADWAQAVAPGATARAALVVSGLGAIDLDDCPRVPRPEAPTLSVREGADLEAAR